MPETTSVIWNDPAVDYLQASLQVEHKAVASTQLAQIESVELCKSSVFIPRHKTWTLISTMFCHAFLFTFCINCQWHGRCKGPPKSHVQYPVLTQEHVLQGSKSKKTGHVCNLEKSVILIAIVVSNKIMFFWWTFFLSQYPFAVPVLDWSIGMHLISTLVSRTLPGCYDLSQYQPYNSTSSPVGTRDLRWYQIPTFYQFQY